MENLTADQLYALQQWAHQMGRSWKASLRDAWLTGNYEGFYAANFLQQIRNSHGPSWLIKFRLPKFVG